MFCCGAALFVALPLRDEHAGQSSVSLVPKPREPIKWPRGEDLPYLHEYAD